MQLVHKRRIGAEPQNVRFSFHEASSMVDRGALFAV
jgi:hypothetical protein